MTETTDPIQTNCNPRTGQPYVRGPYKVKARPYSSLLHRLDGRTLEARHIAAHKAELAAYVGGSPNPAQAAMIERAAVLSLRIKLLELAHGDEATTNHHYLSFSNAYVRAIGNLGIAKPKDSNAPNVLTYLAQMAAQAAEGDGP